MQESYMTLDKKEKEYGTANLRHLKMPGYNGYILGAAPEKVLQFGAGNFLQIFVNNWFDVSNERANRNGKCCLL